MVAAAAVVVLLAVGCYAVVGASTQPGNMRIAKQYSLSRTNLFRSYHRATVLGFE